MKLNKKDYRRIYDKKEGGQLGVIGAAILIGFAIATFFLIWEMNRYVATVGWTGVVTEMHPDNLYPPLLRNGMPISEVVLGHGAKSLLYGAIWIQQHVVLRYIVNGLFLFFVLLVGIAYLYYDLFEQYLNTRLKTLLPRIVFGIILAYSSIWIIEALMVLGKATYVLFWNLPAPFNNWQNPAFITSISPHVRVPGDFMGLLNAIANGYLGFIWVFVIVMEVLSTLILIAVRDFLLALLLVVLPIASLLLIHPWTQRIGSRLWWLAVDLVFLPIIMIIPLALLGLVHNSISFTIAGLAITIGSIYLIAQEPFVLTGAGFTRAGSMLSVGLAGGQLGGSMITAQRVMPSAMMGAGRRLAPVGAEAIRGKLGGVTMGMGGAGGAAGAAGGAAKGGFGALGNAINNSASVLKGKKG